MDKVTRELRRLKGVGAVLAGRFMEAGIDSFEKVVAAGEEGLKVIRGINLRTVPSILSQAAEMAAEASEERVRELRERTAAVTGRVQEIAADIRDRFAEEIAGKTGKKVEKDILRIVASLESVAAKLETKGKRAGKVLSRFEKRLPTLDGAGLKDIRKGLKKTRKTLKRFGFLEKTGK